MKLVWIDGDHTECGRYSINAETVRGEPRWHWLDKMPPEAKAIYDADWRMDGSTRKAAVRALAQRLEDRINP